MFYDIFIIMKKLIRLTESELTNLVRRIINEQTEEDNLSDHIKIYHMYKNGELDKKTFYSFVGILDRHEKERLMDYIKGQKEQSLDEQIEDVYTDSREDFKFDIKAVDCDPSQEYTDGTVDIDEDEDGNDIIVIRYCRGDKKSLRKLTEKGKILMYDKYGYDFSDDKQDTLSTMRGYFGDK